VASKVEMSQNWVSKRFIYSQHDMFSYIHTPFSFLNFVFGLAITIQFLCIPYTYLQMKQDRRISDFLHRFEKTGSVEEEDGTKRPIEIFSLELF